MKHPDLRKKLAQVEGLTDEERAYLQGLLSTTKKYGLVWEDKPEDAEERLKTELPVLEEVVERRVLSPVQEKTAAAKESNQLTLDLAAPAPNVAVADDDTTSPLSTGASVPERSRRASDGGEGGRGGEAPNHLLIEGDNLHALTALSFTHAGKVDVIYIDPPYNTGNKDFKYNDTFVDKEDAYRHSKWLSFMHKRLKIAKTLLKETGVIFISIDDNEQSQLKMLCNEIMGEGNYIATVVNKNKAGAGAKPKGLIEVHEYAIIYSKNLTLINSISIPGGNQEKSLFTKKDQHYERKGAYGTWALATTSMADRPNLKYPITHDNEEIWPEKQWLWSRERVQEAIKNDEIVFNKMKNGKWSVRFKRYEKSDDGEFRSQTPTTFFDGPYTHEGTKEILEILGERAFIFPKPQKYIKRFLEFIYNQQQNPSALILDFFAGSGTTLHATMALNAEDGGNRQCILVTNNENNIAEEVCYERNKRVIEGYTKPNGEFVPGLSGNNLRYYRVGFVGSERTDANRRSLVRNATSMLQVMENCYTNLTESAGFDPALCHIATNDRGRYLVVVYHSRHQRTLTAPLSAWIATLPPEAEPVRLFAFGHDPDVIRADFEDVADRIMPVPLPEAIYNAYRNTFRSLDLYRKPAAPREDETTPENED